MGKVLPKVKLYIFLTVVCVLINMSIFMTVLVSDSSAEGTDFITYKEDVINTNVEDDVNTSLNGLGVSVGTAFIPFASVLSLVIYFGDALPSALTIITGFIFGVIGAMQLTLISLIILNYLPKVLGSGWDV